MNAMFWSDLQISVYHVPPPPTFRGGIAPLSNAGCCTDSIPNPLCSLAEQADKQSTLKRSSLLSLQIFYELFRAVLRAGISNDRCSGISDVTVGAKRQMDTGMNRFIVILGLGLFVLFEICFLTPPICSAQSTGSEQTEVEQIVSGPDDSDAELLKALESMRSRIQELEAQLRHRSKQDTPPTTDSGHDTLATQQSGNTPSSDSRITDATAQSLPGKENEPSKTEPFAFADWTWLNGNPRTKEPAFDAKFFTPEIRADVAYHYDFNHPKDDTIGGSSEVFR